MRLTEVQWEKVKDLLLEGKRKADGRGRLWEDKREIFEGILLILKTGAQWSHVSDKYPPYQICHRRANCRRLQQWGQTGVMSKAVEA